MSDEPLARCTTTNSALWTRRRPGGVVRTDSGKRIDREIRQQGFRARKVHAVQDALSAALSRATRSCEGWPALGRAAAWRRGKPGAYNVCACARGKHGSKKRAGAMAPDASRGQAGGKGGGRENGCMRAPGSAGRRRNAWQRSRRRFPPSEVSVVSRVSGIR